MIDFDRKETNSFLRLKCFYLFVSLNAEWFYYKQGIFMYYMKIEGTLKQLDVLWFYTWYSSVRNVEFRKCLLFLLLFAEGIPIRCPHKAWLPMYLIGLGFKYLELTWFHLGHLSFTFGDKIFRVITDPVVDVCWQYCLLSRGMAVPLGIIFRVCALSKQLHTRKCNFYC